MAGFGGQSAEAFGEGFQDLSGGFDSARYAVRGRLTGWGIWLGERDLPTVAIGGDLMGMGLPAERPCMDLPRMWAINSPLGQHPSRGF